MKQLVFSVRDRASDSFGPPMFMIARGQAIRNFGDAINQQDKDNPLYQHPEDFDLYELGRFDTNTGFFETGTPEMIAVGKDLAQKIN